MGFVFSTPTKYHCEAPTYLRVVLAPHKRKERVELALAESIRGDGK